MNTKNTYTCLQVHNDYQIAGGETKTAEAIATLLEEYGIRVIRYYKTNASFAEYHSIGRVLVGLKSLHNPDTLKEVSAIIKQNHIDFALIHNTTPIISNTIYHVLIKNKIPIIKYLQNYNMVCLNGALDKGELCVHCQRNNLTGVCAGCYKSSKIYSFIKYLIKKDMDKHYLKQIRAFMSNSDFVKNRHVQLGIAPEKIHVMYNYIEGETFTEEIVHQGYLYFGRLSDEKGIFTTIKAFEKIPEAELRILGNGELKKTITTYLSDRGIKNIHYLGEKSGKDLAWEIYRSKYVIVPSEWDEPLPRTILESYCQGTPVIGSDRGGIPEMIKEGETGYIFANGNIERLNEIIHKSEEMPLTEYHTMRDKCVLERLQVYTKAIYYNRFINCIERITIYNG